MAENREDIASDLSAFHRVDDPDRLPIMRYISLAQRLGAYTGVVQLRHKQRPEAPKKMIMVAGRMVPVIDNASPAQIAAAKRQALADRHGVDASQVDYVSSDEILAELRK